MPPAGSRNPGRIELDAFRGLASETLERYLETAVEPYKSDWIEQGRLTSIAEASDRVIEAQRAGQSEVVAAVKHGTSFWIAVLAGIAAWLVSIAITILVAYAAQDWVFQILHVTVVRAHDGG